jgi:hypothetical protein
LKCEKCGYTSFDHNFVCPSCNKDLTKTREKLGISYDIPESLDEFFAAPTVKPPPPPEPDVSLDFDDDFQFTLDD